MADFMDKNGTGKQSDKDHDRKQHSFKEVKDVKGIRGFRKRDQEQCQYGEKRKKVRKIDKRITVMTDHTGKPLKEDRIVGYRQPHRSDSLTIKSGQCVSPKKPVTLRHVPDGSGEHCQSNKKYLLTNRTSEPPLPRCEITNCEEL